MLTVKGAVHILGKICPRSDPDIASMEYSMDPLKFMYTKGHMIMMILDYLNFPMLNPIGKFANMDPTFYDNRVIGVIVSDRYG